MNKEVKQVIVVRKDLNMRKGKIAAQAAHASLAVFFDRITKLSKSEMTIDITKEMHEWIDNSFTKICLYVNSEQELFDIYDEAKRVNIPCALILDSGKTEFKEPTHTAIAIGPDLVDKIDSITGKLPLF